MSDEIQMMADIARWEIDDLLFLRGMKGYADGIASAAKLSAQGHKAADFEDMLKHVRERVAKIEAAHDYRFRNLEGLEQTKESWRKANAARMREPK